MLMTKEGFRILNRISRSFRVCYSTYSQPALALVSELQDCVRRWERRVRF